MTVCCGSRTVPVIEDNRETRDFAAYVLELEGYAVLQAHGGRPGVNLVGVAGIVTRSSINSPSCSFL
jgi:hypothetical protein